MHSDAPGVFVDSQLICLSAVFWRRVGFLLGHGWGSGWHGGSFGRAVDRRTGVGVLTRLGPGSG